MSSPDVRPLRVLLATHSRDRGSTSRTLEAWTRLLPASGVHPIVTLGGDGPLLTALQEANADVHVHPIRRIWEWNRPLPFLSQIASLALRIRRSGADLVHLNEHEHYPVVARAAYLAGVPTVVHVRFKPEAAMCRWLFKKPYTPRRIFFTSKNQMKDSTDAVAEAVPRDRFRLVYNGLNFDRFGKSTESRALLRREWGVDDDTVVIGTASSISARKRLDHVIRVVVELAKAGHKVRGFIAGQPYFEEDERELAALKQLVVDLRAESLVTFLGYVEPAEPLYHAWDICISASEYETFGMSVLEAMACGCPVVAYPGGSVAEVAADAAVMVSDGNLAALVSATARLAGDRAYRRDMANAARERSHAFDVRRSVDLLVAEYRAVLAEAAAPAPVRKAVVGPGGVAATRVLFATNSCDRGSTSRTLEAWARLLPPFGFEPIVTVGGDGPLKSALETAGTAVYRHPIRHFFSWRDPLPFLWAIATLTVRIRRSGAALVHVNEHEHYPVVARAAYLAGVPTIVHVRFRPEPAMCRWLFKPPYVPARVLFTSASQMRDCGDAVAEAVPRDRFHLVYDGLDLTVFGRDGEGRSRLRESWGLSPSTLAIGTASPISPRKRLDHFVRMIGALIKAGADVKGFIAGAPLFPEDEVELRELHALIESEGLKRDVRFLGYVEPVEPLFHAWDVTVSTSLYETFGMSVLEAMSCGRPVLAYRAGSLGEVIGDGGIVLPDGDLDGLIASALRMANDPEYRKTIGARARARAAYFDVRGAVEQLVTEYRRVLNPS